MCCVEIEKRSEVALVPERRATCSATKECTMNKGSRFSFRTALVAVLLSSVFAGGAGYAWWYAETDEGVQSAVFRDAALDAAYRSIATLNSLDYQKVHSGYDHWLAVSTGKLHQQLAADKQGSKERIQQAKTVTEAKVMDAAVSELDIAAGTARVIASVEIRVTPADGKQATKRNRFRADVTRTESGWKLSAIGQVPVVGA